MSPSGILIPVLPRGRVDNVLYWAGIGFAPRALSPEEVLARLEQAASSRLPAVFPSHFLEFDGASQVLGKAGELGVSCVIQVSPGAELEDFMPRLLSERWETKLELIIDRPLHARALENLGELAESGYAFRCVICPTREFDPLKTFLSIPGSWREEARIYFAPRRSSDDRFLSPDEVFLLSRRMGKSLPVVDYLVASEPATLEETEAATRYRQRPDERFFRENYSRLDRASKLRRVLGTLSSARLIAWIRLFPFYLIFFTLDPEEAANDLVRRGHSFVVHPFARFYWKAYSFAHRTSGALRALAVRAYWASYPAIGLLRVLLSRIYWIVHGITRIPRAALSRIYWAAYSPACQGRDKTITASNRAYWLAYHLIHSAIGTCRGVVGGAIGTCRAIRVRSYWKGRSIASVLYWRAYVAIRVLFERTMHPIWTLKTYTPAIYWIAVFPFQKAWWFGSYQVRRRIFHVPMERPK